MGVVATEKEGHKRRKYEEFAGEYDIIPISIETLGSLGESTTVFLKSLAARIRREKGDARAGEYFLQRLSTALQRGNALAVLATMGPQRAV